MCCTRISAAGFLHSQAGKHASRAANGHMSDVKKRGRGRRHSRVSRPRKAARKRLFFPAACRAGGPRKPPRKVATSSCVSPVFFRRSFGLKAAAPTLSVMFLTPSPAAAMRRDVGATVATVALLCSAAVGATAAACGTAARCEGPDGWGLAEAESEQMHAELVQTRTSILSSRSGGPSASQTRAQLGADAGLSAEQRAGLLVPLAWVHVPKTGSSIINTFYHTPAICPTFPTDDYIGIEGDERNMEDMWVTSWGYRDEVCPGGFSDSYMLGNFALPGDHVGVGGLTGQFYQRNRGHFVTMLRQPEQRLISSYYYYGPGSASLREYAEWTAGCTVRQLTGSGPRPFPCLGMYPQPTPTSDDVSVAIHMLHDGFAFVGITDQWALSVCLFRAMFGGQCATSDFADTRPGDNSSSHVYDTSELYGWTDAWDGPLYAEASSMFEHTRSAYGVDSHSCTSFCQNQFD